MTLDTASGSTTKRIHVGGPKPAALVPRQPALRRALPSLAGDLVEAEARAVQEESLEVELHDRKVGGELNVVLSHRRDVSFSVISTQVQVDCFRRSGGDERKDSHLGSDNHWQPRATSGLIRRGPLRRRRHLLAPFVSSPEFVGQALWPGEDPKRSRHRLYQAVRDARRLLGEAVASERDRYWLD